MRAKIGIKIFIVLFIFFIEILSFMFIYSLITHQHENYMQELQEELEELDLVRNFQITLSQVVMPVNDFLIPGGDPNEKENFKLLNAKTENLIEELDKLKFDKSEERQLLNHLKAEYAQVKKIAFQIFNIPQAIGNEEAGRLMEKMDALADDALMDAEKFYQTAHQELEEIRENQETTKKLLDLIVLSGVFLNIILILGSLFFFRRAISLPLLSLKDSALEIGKGNLGERVDIRSNDEIGDLAVSFNKMTENIRLLMQKEKELTASERKKAEELEKAYHRLKQAQDMLVQSEKLAVVGQLAAGVAHEVNNPLFVISGETEMLLKDAGKDEDTKSVLKLILEQSERIKMITGRLLEFSRKKEFRRNLWDVNEIVEKSLFLLNYQVKVENVKIIKELSPDLPGALCDNSQIQEVFVNIMLNAVQAMGNGGRLTVKTRVEKVTEYGRRNTDKFKPGTELVVVEFKDTGTGMDEETLRKIFDPFFSTKEKGSGLGLSVCYGIIENHHGIIEAESKLGEGSTFIVKLPVI